MAFQVNLERMSGMCHGVEHPETWAATFWNRGRLNEAEVLEVYVETHERGCWSMNNLCSHMEAVVSARSVRLKDHI